MDGDGEQRVLRFKRVLSLGWVPRLIMADSGQDILGSSSWRASLSFRVWPKPKSWYLRLHTTDAPCSQLRSNCYFLLFVCGLQFSSDCITLDGDSYLLPSVKVNNAA